MKKKLLLPQGPVSEIYVDPNAGYVTFTNNTVNSDGYTICVNLLKEQIAKLKKIVDTFPITKGSHKPVYKYLPENNEYEVNIYYNGGQTVFNLNDVVEEMQVTVTLKDLKTFFKNNPKVEDKVLSVEEF